MLIKTLLSQFTLYSHVILTYLTEDSSFQLGGSHGRHLTRWQILPARDFKSFSLLAWILAQELINNYLTLLSLSYGNTKARNYYAMFWLHLAHCFKEQACTRHTFVDWLTAEQFWGGGCWGQAWFPSEWPALVLIWPLMPWLARLQGHGL